MMADASENYVPKLKQHYDSVVRQQLQEAFAYANPMSMPKLTKIVVNMGVGEATAVEMKIVHAAAIKLAQARVLKRPIISSWNELLAYCRAAMADEPIEQFRILFLDKKNILIADEIQQRGTVDHTPVYPREVVKRALQLSASAIILVHNHPSGDPTPSAADVTMTNQIVKAADALGVRVHDHLVIGKTREASFKSLGLL